MVIKGVYFTPIVSRVKLWVSNFNLDMTYPIVSPISNYIALYYIRLYTKRLFIEKMDSNGLI